MIYHNDVLFVLHPASFRGYKSGAAGVVQALSAETGKELWRHTGAVPISYLDQPDIFGIDNRVWITDRKAMTLMMAPSWF